jgi:hypothetical protein
MVVLLALLGCHGGTLLLPEPADTFQRGVPVSPAAGLCPAGADRRNCADRWPAGADRRSTAGLWPVGADRRIPVDQHNPSAWPVVDAAIAWRVGLPLQIQPPPPPPLLRMTPRDRARVLAALAGLIILGFMLILLAWWGARFTRRYLRRPWPDQRRRRVPVVSEFDWANKPLYDTRHEDADGERGESRDG